MATKKLIILGKSDATITMILDNLESNKTFPIVKIINNLGLVVEKSFENSAFQIEMSENLDEFANDDNFFLGGIQVMTKRKVFEHFGIEVSKFINIINAFSSISTTAKLGTGCLVNSMVSIAAHSEIGNFVSINRNASVGHHTIISDFVTINPGANVAGNIFIGANSQIGIGANVVDGISIGKNSIVGAGALVTKNVPDNVLVYGSPAKIIREL